VVIISMAVSDVEESSRGLDFLFDINRLNVAVSRARAWNAAGFHRLSKWKRRVFILGWCPDER
jgi:hypothetical protein